MNGSMVIAYVFTLRSAMVVMLCEKSGSDTVPMGGFSYLTMAEGWDFV